ncbi:acyltransferase family protein [Rhodoferax saidenbachensis]|uniref:Peptidoglycan/LPS O-acetylase OafA/YrhL n=1 Tax=Rhodoferax saidenbachensis TaxID=1484693 RepID=A0ABU1ZIG0_9BURK|nr:acyltransferase family protein [Rhodoferax saidenbachensis]MDR7305273.1 peptidoglycan/LPS O-acetylase OafA/YrhL [Rhodoferax saidenbachensis]
MSYRADVDGLRAVAVLLVVLYHGYPAEFNAGQIGVDIFFVISGYLITGLVVDGIAQDRFLFSDFYARRIRRIFPALVTVLFFSLVLGWFTLLRFDFEQLGRQVLAGSLFAANFLYWSDVGYFDAAAEKKILLHLWSLGVEEQFYIFFPILLVFLRKEFRLRSVAILFVVSFALYLGEGSSSPSSAFYLPHTRFWQILGGALLAVWQRERSSSSSIGDNIAALGGLGFLALSLYGLRQPGEFASYVSMFPVAGAMLLLYGRSSWVNSALLSRRPMVFIGKISFPLYLWHWVLLSFCHIFEDSKPFIEVRNPALILSFFLAWATYVWVEKPVRFGRWKGSSSLLLLWPFFAVLAASGYIYLSGGVPWRAAAQISQLNQGDVGQQEFLVYLKDHAYPCTERGWVAAVNEKGVSSRCAQSHPGPAIPSYVLLGDSHAEHLFPGLAQQHAETTLAYTTREGLPLISNQGFTEVFQAIRADYSVKGVLLSAHWASKLQGMDSQAFYADLQATLAFFTSQGKVVYLLDDVPIFPFNAERCAYADRIFISNMCTADVGAVTHTPWALSKVVEAPLVTYFNLEKYLCGKDDCRMALEGQLLYRDRNHLNINGSRYIAQALQREYPNLFP